MVTDIVKEILDVLSKKREKLVLVESCTGGLVSSIFTSVPGASNSFWGSFVVYDNEAKKKMVGVSSNVLDKYGAVSSECVDELLFGALKLSNCDFAAAVSGIAGPSGGTKEKPVGTVFIGVMDKNNNKIINRYLFKGDRDIIRDQSVIEILNLLKKII